MVDCRDDVPPFFFGSSLFFCSSSLAMGHEQSHSYHCHSHHHTLHPSPARLSYSPLCLIQEISPGGLFLGRAAHPIKLPTVSEGAHDRVTFGWFAPRPYRHCCSPYSEQRKKEMSILGPDTTVLHTLCFKALSIASQEQPEEQTNFGEGPRKSSCGPRRFQRKSGERPWEGHVRDF